MGNPPEEQHLALYTALVQVTLTEGFWFGQHEVTQAEWLSVMPRAQWKGKRNVKRRRQLSGHLCELEGGDPILREAHVNGTTCGTTPARLEIRFAHGGAVGVRVPGGNQISIFVRRKRAGPQRLRLVEGNPRRGEHQG